LKRGIVKISRPLAKVSASSITSHDRSHVIERKEEDLSRLWYNSVTQVDQVRTLLLMLELRVSKYNFIADKIEILSLLLVLEADFIILNSHECSINTLGRLLKAILLLNQTDFIIIVSQFIIDFDI